MSDTGPALATDDGRVLVSHLVDPDARIEVDGNVIRIEGRFGFRKQQLSSPVKQMAFRTLNMTVGRANPNLLRATLQKVLITGKPWADVTFVRTLTVEDDDLIVEDSIDATQSDLRFTRLLVGSDATSIYVANSNVFQESVLLPWVELPEQLDALARNRRIDLPSTIPPAKRRGTRRSAPELDALSVERDGLEAEPGSLVPAGLELEDRGAYPCGDAMAEDAPVRGHGEALVSQSRGCPTPRSASSRGAGPGARPCPSGSGISRVTSPFFRDTEAQTGRKLEQARGAGRGVRRIVPLVEGDVGARAALRGRGAGSRSRRTPRRRCVCRARRRAPPGPSRNEAARADGRDRAASPSRPRRSTRLRAPRCWRSGRIVMAAASTSPDHRGDDRARSPRAASRGAAAAAAGGRETSPRSSTARAKRCDAAVLQRMGIVGEHELSVHERPSPRRTSCRAEAGAHRRAGCVPPASPPSESTSRCPRRSPSRRSSPRREDGPRGRSSP